MSLEQQIMTEMKAAMLAKNEAALRGLRAIKSAILLAKTADGAKAELSEDDELKLLQKLAKQRRDSLDVFTQQNREDLAQKEKEELDLIERFLPKPLSDDELRAALKAIIAETGAAGPGDMGKVMGTATKALTGKADGSKISAMVRELLTA